MNDDNARSNGGEAIAAFHECDVSMPADDNDEQYQHQKKKKKPRPKYIYICLRGWDGNGRDTSTPCGEMSRRHKRPPSFPIIPSETHERL